MSPWATEHIAAKEASLAAKKRFVGNKRALLSGRHSYGRSTVRHCRQATKLRPRCLMRVATTMNGEALMKRILLGAAAIVAFAAPAFAADIPPRTYTKAPAYTAPELVYSWTGFYIGGHLGGTFTGNNSLEGSGSRFTCGVQGCFRYPFATNWVVRAEAQYTWLSSNNKN